MTEPVRIPIAEARCPWCGSKLGEWSVGSSAACLASGWATRTAVGPTACPVDWRGGRVDHPRPKIETASVCPPIPDRRFDWQATYEDYDGAEDSATRGHVGHGPTEQAAIADLTENFPRPITEWPSAGLYLVLDDPRDVVAWQLRRSLDVAEMQGEQGRDWITKLQVGIIIARAEAEVACRHVELARVDLSIAEGGRDDAAADVERLVHAARQSRALLRACILVGIIQVLVGLALAACWPSDPPALAPVALVLGGCAAMVVGGWPAVRRTWTTGASTVDAFEWAPTMKVSKPAPRALPTAGLEPLPSLDPGSCQGETASSSPALRRAAGVSGGAQHTSADPTDSGEEKE